MAESVTESKYALLIWPTDGNLTSVHLRKHILHPKKSHYMIGDECLTLYPGQPGKDGTVDGKQCWKSRILGFGGK